MQTFASAIDKSFHVRYFNAPNAHLANIVARHWYDTNMYRGKEISFTLREATAKEVKQMSVAQWVEMPSFF